MMLHGDPYSFNVALIENPHLDDIKAYPMSPNKGNEHMCFQAEQSQSIENRFYSKQHQLIGIGSLQYCIMTDCGAGVSKEDFYLKNSD